MKINKIELKKIIVEETKKVLKEEEQMTTHEKELQDYMNALQAWGSQLTPVKYRQLEQDVAAVFGVSDPIYKNLVLAADNAIQNKGTAKDAIFINDISKGSRYGVRLQSYLKKSGFKSTIELKSLDSSEMDSVAFPSTTNPSTNKTRPIKKQDKPWYKKMFGLEENK